MRLPATRPDALAVALALALPAAGCFEPQPCPTPLESCGGVCYDLRSDRDHCGSCSTRCAAGLSCLGGTCGADPNLACPDRTGGAFVTLSVGGEVVKFWTVAEPFIARAEELLQQPGSAGPAVPSFDIREASDCDGQWSWHPDRVTPIYTAVADLRCNVRPSVIEGARASWIGQAWCPSPAPVLAVDRR